MNELQQCLGGASAAAPAAQILEALTEEVALRHLPGAPRSIYAEVWHLAYWQQMTLDWVRDSPRPVPARAALGFPTDEQQRRESWALLCRRFLGTLAEAEELAGVPAELERVIVCPSPAGKPDRRMTVREQLESLVAHNAYHLGRVVLLRQMMEAWPPPSGGFTW